MSAYVVDNETINSILAGIDASLAHGDGLHRPEGPPLVELPEELQERTAALKKWGGRLRRMNEDAVLARYPDDSRESIPGPIDEAGKLLPYQYKPCTAPPVISLVKAISCYLYECSEGNIASHALFQALETWERDLCEWIVKSSPEYEMAKWD